MSGGALAWLSRLGIEGRRTKEMNDAGRELPPQPADASSRLFKPLRHSG
jgi:hypothetical protein